MLTLLPMAIELQSGGAGMWTLGWLIPSQTKL